MCWLPEFKSKIFIACCTILLNFKSKIFQFFGDIEGKGGGAVLRIIFILILIQIPILDPHWIKMDPDPGHKLYEPFRGKEIFIISFLGFESQKVFSQFLVDIFPLESGSRKPTSCRSNGSRSFSTGRRGGGLPDWAGLDWNPMKLLLEPRNMELLLILFPIVEDKFVVCWLDWPHAILLPKPTT